MLFSSHAVSTLARRAANVSGKRSFASLGAYEHYGQNVFTGSVADEYLQKHGADGSVLSDPSWTKNNADIVAAAVLDW